MNANQFPLSSSERVRVERLFAEYLVSCCSLRSDANASSTLKKPLLLNLRKADINHLLEEGDGTMFSEMLTFWGFSWTLEPADQAGENAAPSPTAVRITSVPKALKERLTADAPTVAAIFSEVLDLDPAAISARLNWMRQRRAAGGQKFGGVHGKDDGDDGGEPMEEEVQWLSMLRHLPPTIRRLLESKACRGAISE